MLFAIRHKSFKSSKVEPAVQWRSQDADVMWAQHGPKTPLFLAVLYLI